MIIESNTKNSRNLREQFNFTEVIKFVVKKLQSTRFSNDFQIKYWKEEKPPKEIINELKAIEMRSFPSELRYVDQEYEVLFEQKNALLITISNQKQEIKAFLLTYQDFENPSDYYIDTCASTLKRKGLIKLLITVVYIWAFLNGYKELSVRRDEFGYDGAPLRDIYVKHGFQEIRHDKDGIYMKLEISKEYITELFPELTQIISGAS
ncbi:MAG: hypothetical protein ACFFCQ_15335 [Promethearchaeota archaeon]